MTIEATREMWRRARARYRAKHEDRCTRCARLRDLAGKWCARCLAWHRELRLPGVEHDRALHVKLLKRAVCPRTKCQASDLTLRELARIGERLEIDRIEPYRGYVRGNVQLIAASLNRAKARALEVPEYAIDALRYAVAGPRHPEAALMASLSSGEEFR